MSWLVDTASILRILAFPILGWTQQGKELKDKEMLLNGVRTAACEFIEIIDAHFQEIEHTKEVNEPTQSAQEQELQEKPTESIYYSIDEEAARRAKEANSFSDYLPGSATENYRQSIDAATKIAERQKLQVDASFHDKIDGLLDTYARKLAENLNKSFEINARVPSMMITGEETFQPRKKKNRILQGIRIWKNGERFKVCSP
ncbi:hypothetical protein EYB33_00570 (plasmid) [Lysinibacillus sphaericus]|uniref:hypothetical protein n=1 Tax=Lysinibacillus sphaericus TaxID=1421 RepID=UPI0039837754|nr:hypothetical protein EYB33_00570 [Lysinibacillus sphaericus]